MLQPKDQQLIAFIIKRMHMAQKSPLQLNPKDYIIELLFSIASICI